MIKNRCIDLLKKLSTKFEDMVLNFFACDPFFAKRTSDILEPDILCPQLCYIECTVVRRGHDCEANFQEINSNGHINLISEEKIEAITNFMGVRLSNRFSDKNEQFQRHSRGGKMDGNLPRILCVTVDIEEFSRDFRYQDLWEDAIYRLLYQVDINAVVVSNSCRRAVQNTGPFKKDKNGAEVCTGLFLGNKYSNISGLLFVMPYVFRPISKTENLGCDILHSGDVKLHANDLRLFINSNANTKIEIDLVRKFCSCNISVIPKVDS